MTRINVVPVNKLCDKHLLAELREIKRIPNLISQGKYNMEGQPSEYTLGTGHVKFFYDKITYLQNRYGELFIESKKRGFKVKDYSSSFIGLPSNLYNDYIPTGKAIIENVDRIIDRLPKNAKFTDYILIK